MRWHWIDRILLHDLGKRLVTIKNVACAEEHVHDHFPADGAVNPMPIMPGSLVLEGMAQTAGVLVGAANAFREKVVLAKIAFAELTLDAEPGQTLRYDATIERMDASGANVHGVIDLWDHAQRSWTRIGSVEMIVSHVDQNIAGKGYPEENFVFGENLRNVLGMLRRADGEKASGASAAWCDVEHTR